MKSQQQDAHLPLFYLHASVEYIAGLVRGLPEGVVGMLGKHHPALAMREDALDAAVVEGDALGARMAGRAWCQEWKKIVAEFKG